LDNADAMPTQTEARGTKLMIGAAFMSAGNIIRFGLQLVMLPILGRILGPHVYGLASFAMPLISLASLVSDTGLSNAIAGGAEMSVLIESNIFWVSVVSGGAFALLVCLIAVPMGYISGQMEIIPVIIGLSPLLIVNAATTLLNGLIIRRHKFWAFMVGDILSFLLSSLIAITLALSGFGIWSLVAQMLVLTSVKFVWLFSVSRPAIILHMKPSEIRGLISFGLDVVGTNVFNFIGRNVDNMIIGWMLGLTNLGWYAMAYQVITMPDAIVSGPILAAVYPKLGKISGDLPAVRKVFKASLSVVATIVTPAFVGLGATADLAVPLILGDKWLPSVHLIQLLSLAGWLFCIYSVFYTTLLATGRSRDQLRLGAYLATATAIGVAGGVMFGAAGVGIGVGLATVSAAPWYVRLARTKWGIGATDILEAFVAPVAGAIFMLVVLMTSRHSGLDRFSPLAELPLLIALGCAAYLGFIALFGRRTIFGHLTIARQAHERGAPP
jgi:O-antigen/teichoic acid export membrane protein